MTWKEAIIRATRDLLAFVGFVFLSGLLARSVFGEVPLPTLTVAQVAVIVVAWRWANGRWFWQPPRADRRQEAG